MAMISTMGKLRMVKAMTGRAIPRMMLLQTNYVKNATLKENDEKTEVPEGVILASKTGDNVESSEPEEHQPGAIPHLQS